MEDNQNQDENLYSAEEIEKIGLDAIEQILTGVQYDDQKAQVWINQLNEKIMQNLLDLGKPYKYIVNVAIMQKNGAGAFVTTSNYWDTVADGCVIINWPKEKQAKGEQQKHTLQCLMTIYAVSLIQL